LKFDFSQVNSSPALDELSINDATGPALYKNVTILECVSETVLDEALMATDLKNYVMLRISPTCVMVDDAVLPELIKNMTKKGYEPRVVK
jgi:hypothetical protein